MITYTVLGILGLVLLVVLVLMARAPSARRKQVSAPAPQPAVGPGTATELASARNGDVVSIRAAAADYSDVDFVVDKRSYYQAAGRRWPELSGEYRGDRLFVEVHSLPEASAMVLLDPRRLTLTDIHTSEQQLADMDTKQNPWLYLEYDGKRWQWESSRELEYFENEQGPAAGLYRWLFNEKDGDRLLLIEKWEGEPFDVRIARRLSLKDITVYRAA